MVSEPTGTSKYSWYVLSLLLCVYVSNQWTRYLINYLYGVSGNSFKSIKTALDLSSSNYGILIGFGFSLVYVISGLFVGRAADKYNRRNIVFLGLLIWNLAVVLMGSANGFGLLLVSRIMLGFGQSFSSPASYSMIADYFPVEQRATANGMYAWGVYVGGGLSSLSIIMAEHEGWRGTCFTIASIGLVLSAVFVLSVREPPRASAEEKGGALSDKKDAKGEEKVISPDDDFKGKDPTLWENTKEMLRIPVVVTIFVAGMVRFIAGYTSAGFVPSFFGSIFSSYTTEYSVLNASVVAVGGAASSYFGGKIADAWEKKGQKHARLYVCAIGCILPLPFIPAMIFSTNFYFSMFCLFMIYLTSECWFGPAISVLQNNLKPNMRGFGIAAFTFVVSMGGSLATYLEGVYLESNDTHSGIKHLVFTCLFSSYLIAGIFFYAGTRVKNEYTDEEVQPLMRRVSDDEEEL
jgi:MFS family permease